jgi:hypothetical protein
MASSSDDKGKKPMEEDHQDLKLKEEQVAGGSRARDPNFVGSMNAGGAFSHNMQVPTLPVLDLNFLPVIKEGLLVTDELCAQYRVLEREIQILQEENLRLRRMLELFLAPIMMHHHRQRSNSSLVLASPWFVPSLGECCGVTSLSFTHLPFK